MDSKEIYDEVNKHYGSVTKSNSGQYEHAVAKAFGYSEEDLVGLPDGANLGLSCGNPIALAKLNEGETVIDLGSGAGFDVFAASKKVGESGRAIGVDMNENMIAKANANKAKVDATNVEFIQSPITSIPLPDDTANCIISNCVINLVPDADKQAAFTEMFRLLKPGGRLAISDILARKEFTDELRKNIALYVGCVAGASQVSEYETYLRTAGFNDVLIVDAKSDLNAYFTVSRDNGSCCAPSASSAPVPCCGASSQTSKTSMETLAKTMVEESGVTDFNEWAGSFKIYAIKP